MIRRPTLVVREETCRNNIRRMAEKARLSGVDFRPHFKTHQSVHVGEWFREYGVEKITVSSASMAKHFAAAGWEDITIAFPANLREAGIYNSLSRQLKLQLLLDSPEVATGLAGVIKNNTGIFIEIDCGYGRSGLKYDRTDTIRKITEIIERSDCLMFTGFLIHDGDTYHAGNKNEVIDIHQHSLKQLQLLRSAFPEAIISMGDTPSCSILDSFEGMDEIRPGNFVYYDLMQEQIGSCNMRDIAVSVACPVTGIYPDRQEIVIYGGAVHLSKEYLEEDGKYYGLVVQYLEEGWTDPVPATRVVSLSQEHGIIRTTPEFIDTVKHGDLLGILPVHSCLTAELLQENTLLT